MRIVIGGDVCPIGRNEPLFVSGSGRLRNVADIFGRFDLNIVNLECPLIGVQSPITKGGPVLGAHAGAARGLQECGVAVASLANNHIMDHGWTGLRSTLDALDGAGIAHVGAGANLAEAAHPLLIERCAERVAVLSFAEREYSYATPGRPGACPFDLPLVVRSIRLIPEATFLIVLVHGGNEHFEYPSPRLQDTCRMLVELGAGAVICQHSHCAGATERYGKGLIVYGQGNMLFDMPSRHESWWRGVLVMVECCGGTLTNFELLPIEQRPGTEVLRTLDARDAAEMLQEIARWSEDVCDPHVLEQRWRAFCARKRRSYQALLFGYSKWQHRINRILGCADWRTRGGNMNIGNVLRCDSHLEVLRTLYSLESTTGEANA